MNSDPHFVNEEGQELERRLNETNKLEKINSARHCSPRSDV